MQTPSELVLNQSMLLSDDVLKVPSSQATEALEAASMQLDWYKEDAKKKQFIAFTSGLLFH